MPAIKMEAPHQFALTKQQLELKIDKPMDIDVVRPGAIVVTPVKEAGFLELVREQYNID